MRVEATAALVADLAASVRLQPSYLLPYLRVALHSLQLPSLPQLQAHTSTTILAAFANASTERQQEIASLLLSALLPSIATDGRFLVDSDVSVHPATALMILLVQGSVHLPGHDEPPATVPGCFKAAFHWADLCWTALLDAVPQTKAAKCDADINVKPLLDAFVNGAHALQRSLCLCIEPCGSNITNETDVLALHVLPEWPAASVVLVRGALMLGGARGLQHPETGPRLLAIDMLGTILARLWRGAADVEAQASALRALRDAAGSTAPTVQHLLVRHLGAKYTHHVTPVLDPAASALPHVVARLCAEEATMAADDEGAWSNCLTRHRDLLQRYMDGDMGNEPLPRADACIVMAAWVHSGLLAHVRTKQLQLLVECCEPGKQAPTIRTRAMRALGLAVEADPRLLAVPDVQHGVSRALEGDSVAVRDAALELLGRHIGDNEALALAYFDVLGRAAADPGTSVRKRALRILLDCCAKVPGFPRAADACVHVLLRATDEEEPIQTLVLRSLHDLWMADTGMAADRARQLAAVTMVVHQAGGRASLQLPMTPQHKLVAALKGAATLTGNGTTRLP